MLSRLLALLWPITISEPCWKIYIFQWSFGVKPQDLKP